MPFQLYGEKQETINHSNIANKMKQRNYGKIAEHDKTSSSKWTVLQRNAFYCVGKGSEKSQMMAEEER